jgi:hypothetical protein
VEAVTPSMTSGAAAIVVRVGLAVGVTEFVEDDGEGETADPGG